MKNFKLKIKQFFCKHDLNEINIPFSGGKILVGIRFERINNIRKYDKFYIITTSSGVVFRNNKRFACKKCNKVYIQKDNI